MLPTTNGANSFYSNNKLKANKLNIEEISLSKVLINISILPTNDVLNDESVESEKLEEKVDERVSTGIYKKIQKP